MNNRTWVENLTWLIIVLNIFVLSHIFLIPRAHFVVVNWNLSREALMETLGVKDIPNQYARTYKVANQIRKITRSTSIIFMPRDDREFGTTRSVMIQRLYPRELYFFGDKGFENKMNSLVNKGKNFYIVFNDTWGKRICENKQIQSLKSPGFGICLFDTINFVNP